MTDPHHDDDVELNHDEHEGGHDEPWLVSYADMMTLLFGFFVLMYTFAAAKLDEDDALVKMRKEVAVYFGGEYVTPMEEVVSEFKKQLGGKIPERFIQTKLSPEGLEIVFQSQSLFASGSAKLFPHARNAIAMLISIVKKKGADFEVKVEGHTDDVPISTRKFPSNWELSGARAASVIRMFEAAGFDSEKLVAIGYGDSRPLYPNRDDAGQPIRKNQMLNRRVRIKILGGSPIASSSNAKIADQQGVGL